jgi:hypothetical protein
MSTASTMSSITHTPPPSQGHSYRPSRGHARSGRSTQIPSFVAPPAPSGQESQPDLSSGQINGKAPGSTWGTAASFAHHHHGPSHSHSHSHSHASLPDPNTATTRAGEVADGLLGNPGPSTSSVNPFQSSAGNVPLRYVKSSDPGCRNGVFCRLTDFQL